MKITWNSSNEYLDWRVLPIHRQRWDLSPCSQWWLPLWQVTSTLIIFFSTFSHFCENLAWLASTTCGTQMREIWRSWSTSTLSPRPFRLSMALFLLYIHIAQICNGLVWYCVVFINVNIRSYLIEDGQCNLSYSGLVVERLQWRDLRR